MIAQCRHSNKHRAIRMLRRRRRHSTTRTTSQPPPRRRWCVPGVLCCRHAHDVQRERTPPPARNASPQSSDAAVSPAGRRSPAGSSPSSAPAKRVKSSEHGMFSAVVPVEPAVAPPRAAV